jgi:hypothetical protein
MVGGVIMTAVELLQELRVEQSTLVSLVERVATTGNPFVVVSPNAVTRWSQTEPKQWAHVREWFREHGIALITI